MQTKEIEKKTKELETRIKELEYAYFTSWCLHIILFTVSFYLIGTTQ